MRRYDYILWDWNGTLLDDLALNLEIENRLLARRGLQQMASKEIYLDCFDFPIIRFYETLGFDFSKESYADVADEYIREFDHVEMCADLFPDARRTLQALQERGIQQIIISAAAQTILDAQMQKFGIGSYFDAVLGSNNHLGKSKVDTALCWLRDHHVDPALVAFVGDTTHDFETATALGCDCFFVARGHNAKARLLATGCEVFDSLDSLCERLIGS